MSKHLIFLLLIFLTVSGFTQDKRLALVIGNAAYQHGGALKNPVNDANLMTQTLQDLNFEVIKETDASLTGMQSAFKGFVSRLSSYDVALFFYAGHGMQVDGENYLIPVDAKLENKLSMEFETFKVSSVNRYFAANNDKLNIMILDACRNNPYRSWMRSGGRGFKAVSDQGAGTIIAFATREGEVASDGDGNNGLFTEQLVKQMRTPQNITDVFQNTRVEVLRASNNQQVPQEWNMLTGNFYFSQTANLSDANPDKLPSMGSSVSLTTYGSIELTSEISGSLYLDGKLLGKVSANSKTPIKNVATGIHRLEIRGTENWNGNATVGKDRTTRLTVESAKKMVDIPFMDMVYVQGGSFMMGTDVGDDEEKPVHEVYVEAEWEYAARGGNKSNGAKYSGGNALSSVGWYKDNSGGKTHPVGEKLANELGIYDMSGNVWEWCGDWYGSDYYSASVRNNPQGPTSGDDRVIRGGSWADFAEFERVASRLWSYPDYGNLNYGFRVARDVN